MGTIKTFLRRLISSIKSIKVSLIFWWWKTLCYVKYSDRSVVNTGKHITIAGGGGFPTSTERALVNWR